MIDIATVVVLLACVFSAVTGKAAARKSRFWPAWCLCGALSGPFALLYVLLAPRLLPCPSCGRNIRVKPGRPCGHCGWTPPPLHNARIASDLRETFGFRLGDRVSRVEQSLTKAGTPFERPSESCIRCARETFGHPGDVTIEFDEGRTRRVRVSYPADRDYRVYYDLKTTLVAKYGKPCHEQSETGHTDSWAAKELDVTLWTAAPVGRTADAQAAPSTTVVYQKRNKKSAKQVSLL